MHFQFIYLSVPRNVVNTVTGRHNKSKFATKLQNADIFLFEFFSSVSSANACKSKSLRENAFFMRLQTAVLLSDISLDWCPQAAKVRLFPSLLDITVSCAEINYPAASGMNHIMPFSVISPPEQIIITLIQQRPCSSFFELLTHE